MAASAARFLSALIKQVEDRGKFKIGTENESLNQCYSSTPTTNIKVTGKNMESTDLSKEGFEDCKGISVSVETADDSGIKISQPSPDSSNLSKYPQRKFPPLDHHGDSKSK